MLPPPEIDQSQAPQASEGAAGTIEIALPNGARVCVDASVNETALLRVLRAMRHHIKVRWRMALQRRSQRQRMGWRRMEGLADRYLPQPSILHPWPEQRFLVKHSR